jgi:hypothetical protein
MNRSRVIVRKARVDISDGPKEDRAPDYISKRLAVCVCRTA